MVRNNCESLVKDLVKGFHTKCCYNRPVEHVTGDDLNTAFGISDFESNKKYKICYYLYRQKVQPALKKIQEHNLKTVNETQDVQECSDANSSQKSSQQSTNQSRCGYRTKFPEEVLKECSDIRKSYTNLCMRIRQNRVNSFAQKVLAQVVCEKSLKENGMAYLENNKSLADDVEIFLDAVKERIIQGVLRINLNDVSCREIPRPPEINLETEEQHKKALQFLYMNNQREYNHMRKLLIDNDFISANGLPTYYYIQKLRPKVEEFVVKSQCIYCDDPTASDTQSTDDQVVAAKLHGSYPDHVNILSKRCKRKLQDDSANKYNEKEIVLDSYDGAHHTNNVKKKRNIISFSSQLLSERTVHQIGSSAESANILTWMQELGQEKAETLFPLLKDVYKSKHQLSTIDGNRVYYDMHDGKMLYILTQHSLYNRKHHPFILCTCKRGDAVRDPNYVCKLIPHEQHLNLWARSKRRWEHKRTNPNANEKYDAKHHNDWIDEKNSGISHFGIHPDYLRNDHIRFDVFHMTCAITKRLMCCLREFILKQSCDTMDMFNNIIGSFWGAYNVQVWKLNKDFSSFIGSEVKAFINNIPKIVSFLKNKFLSTEYLCLLIEGMEIWPSLVSFLSITKIGIGEKDHYIDMLNTFQTNLKKFYSAGAKSFLTKGKVVGDDETFYMHCLRCYTPNIAEITYKQHHLGVGIFTMQGYERRNKESKWSYSHHTNKKGNILTQNLHRLHDLFLMD